MDPYDFTQISVVVLTALVLGRLGVAVARRIERPRLPDQPSVEPERLRALEDECGQLRREIGELQERQDFTERLLFHEPGRPPLPPRAEPRVTTPH